MDISVLIVNYNHGDYLPSCLRSVIGAAGTLRYEIFVVDNRSKDGSCQKIRQQFPQVYLIENPKNVGFARAVNQAYRRAQGEFLLILNPDIQVFPGAIEKMFTYLQHNPQVGLVLPKLVNADGSLQYSCRTFASFITLLFRRAPLGRLFPHQSWVRRHLMTDWDHQQIREVDWGLGACMLVRRRASSDRHLMDERYFLYIEDIDLCLTLQRTGWKVVYHPDAVMVHHHLRQSAQGLSRARWEHLTSQLKFYLKYRSFRPHP
jgi:GT2 family glycosyltransferase